MRALKLVYDMCIQMCLC